MSGFADVAVDRPQGAGGGEDGGLILTYAVPDGLEARPGHLVLVPLSKGIVQGIIVALAETTAVENVRELLRLVDEVAVLTPDQIALGRWIAATYRCALYQALALMLPPGLAQHEVVTVEVTDAGRRLKGGDLARLTERQAHLLGILRAGGGVLTTDQVRARFRDARLGETVRQLETRGLLTRRSALLRPKAQPRHELFVQLHTGVGGWGLGVGASGAGEDGQRPRHASGRCRRPCWSGCGRSRLATAMATGMGTDTTHARTPATPRTTSPSKLRSLTPSARTPNPTPTLQHPTPTQIQNPIGIPLAPSTRPPGRDGRRCGRWSGTACCGSKSARSGATRWPTRARRCKTRPCSPCARARCSQQIVVALHETVRWTAAATENHLTPNPQPPTPIFLLHGVTGSGKTEIYLRAIGQALRLGRQAIMLVPEIALTPQMVHRFAGRFPDRVAMLHSGLSAGRALRPVAADPRRAARYRRSARARPSSPRCPAWA